MSRQTKLAYRALDNSFLYTRVVVMSAQWVAWRKEIVEREKSQPVVVKTLIRVYVIRVYVGKDKGRSAIWLIDSNKIYATDRQTK